MRQFSGYVTHYICKLLWSKWNHWPYTCLLVCLFICGVLLLYKEIEIKKLLGKNGALTMLFFRRIGGVYLISSAWLKREPRWIIANPSWKCQLPDHCYKYAAAKADTAWTQHESVAAGEQKLPKHDAQLLFFFSLHETTGAEWDKCWLKFWNYDSDPRWIWNSDSSVSGIGVFNPSVLNVRFKNPSSTLRVLFNLVPYVGTLVEGMEECTYIILTATTQRLHNWYLRCVPISWRCWSTLAFSLRPPSHEGSSTRPASKTSNEVDIFL